MVITIAHRLLKTGSTMVLWVIFDVPVELTMVITFEAPLELIEPIMFVRLVPLEVTFVVTILFENANEAKYTEMMDIVRAFLNSPACKFHLSDKQNAPARTTTKEPNPIIPIPIYGSDALKPIHITYDNPNNMTKIPSNLKAFSTFE